MTWLKNALTALREGGDVPTGGGASEDASLSAVTPEGLELSHLGRYLVVAVLVTVCALLFAWSRIEMVEISTDLGAARNQLTIAQAEAARLDLELAALSDPAHLSRAATELALTTDVPVVDVPPAGATAE
jgi:hypothetical protein